MRIFDVRGVTVEPSRPHWSIAHLVSLLGDEGTRLAALSAGDLRVRSAFEMSHRRLTGEARLVFQRLAFIPGPDFGVELAAVATGLPDAQVRLYIDELVDANLLQTSVEDGRYSYHDLIRLFARERLEAEEDPDDLAKVRCGLVSYLLDNASVAAEWSWRETGEYALTIARRRSRNWLQSWH